MSEILKNAIRKKYGKAIAEKRGCCQNTSASSCCGGNNKATQMVTGNLYSEQDFGELSYDMVASSFGCGNPTALMELHAGETVLDLGSGAGLDVLLSAKRVGPAGWAYGLDMTEEMLEAARENQRKAGIDNACFLKGEMENIPLPENAVDVVISNCVINLSADKGKVFEECFRVLKPGGRFAVADIVLLKELPEKLQKDITAWAGCVAGALSALEYEQKLADAGFTDVTVETTRVYDFTETASEMFAALSQEELLQLEGAVASCFIRAKKPKHVRRKDVDFKIRKANLADWPQVYKLLLQAKLPTAGAKAHLKDFLVAVLDSGQFAGVIGMEREGRYGMLRSLAVKPECQKGGIAAELVREAVATARALEMEELYLMTQTADRYLQNFGFEVISRSQIPEVLLEKSELNTACSARSICMKQQLA